MLRAYAVAVSNAALQAIGRLGIKVNDKNLVDEAFHVLFNHDGSGLIEVVVDLKLI